MRAQDILGKAWLAGGCAGSLLALAGGASAATIVPEGATPSASMAALPGPAPASRIERAFFSPVSAHWADLNRLPFWQSVVARAQRECFDADACFGATIAAQLKALHGLSPRAQLERVNQLFNAVPYVSDAENWGVADYWETPAEFAARGGDCEDFAIAKYFALRALGFSADDLRVAVVLDETTRQRHAVLTVRFDGDVLVLDNLTEALSAARFAAYRPLLAVNEQSWWWGSVV